MMIVVTGGSGKLGSFTVRALVDSVVSEGIGGVVGDTGPPHPRAPSLLQDRDKRTDKAARARFPLVVNPGDRKPVGSNDNAFGQASPLVVWSP